MRIINAFTYTFFILYKSIFFSSLSNWIVSVKQKKEKRKKSQFHNSKLSKRKFLTNMSTARFLQNFEQTRMRKDKIMLTNILSVRT